MMISIKGKRYLRMSSQASDSKSSSPSPYASSGLELPSSSSSSSSSVVPLGASDVDVVVSATDHVGCWDAFLYKIGLRSRHQAMTASLDAIEVAPRSSPLIDRVQAGIVRYTRIYGSPALQSSMLTLLTSINGGIRAGTIRLSAHGVTPLRDWLYKLAYQTTVTGKIDATLAARVLLSTMGEDRVTADSWSAQVSTFEAVREAPLATVPLEVRELFAFIEESVRNRTRDDETRLRTLWTFVARSYLGAYVFVLSLPRVREMMAAAGREQQATPSTPWSAPTSGPSAATCDCGRARAATPPRRTRTSRT